MNISCQILKRHTYLTSWPGCKYRDLGLECESIFYFLFDTLLNETVLDYVNAQDQAGNRVIDAPDINI